MIDQAEANAVEPAESPEQILIDPFIGEKIHQSSFGSNVDRSAIG
jgi:hypothetical protein